MPFGSPPVGTVALDIEDSFADASHDGAGPWVVETSVHWGEGDGRSCLYRANVKKGGALCLGDGAHVDVAVPEGVLGAAKWSLVSFDGEQARVRLPPGAALLIDGALGGAPEEVRLGPGQRAKVLLRGMSVRIAVVREEKAPRYGVVHALRDGVIGTVALSAFLHGTILGSFAHFLPRLAADEDVGIGRDQILVMQRMLDAAAEREREVEPAPVGDASLGETNPSGGGKALGDAGKIGGERATRPGHWTAPGNARPEERSLTRRERMDEARNFGMNEVLGQAASAMAGLPTLNVPWDRVLLGSDAEAHAGDMWSLLPGDVAGSGLSLSGPGEGGGGTNEGIGINDLGGLSRSLSQRVGPGGGDRDGMGGCKPGQKCGRLQGYTHTPAIQMRMAKEIETNGRLPAEVIQRIVRANAGRFRGCYESGLAGNPSLAGRVAVRFVIDRTGGVSLAADSGSDLPDVKVRACVVRNFYSLSFPEPVGGTVTVTYPIVFQPE